MQANAGQHAGASTQRIALFDNIKGILIILVVLGHMMHPVHNDNLALSATFDIIYLFHMPLFVLLSGLFAKSTYRDGKLNTNRIISFLVLGVIFQATLTAINGNELSLASLIRFPSAPWYLIAMGWWSAMTPVLHWLGPLRGIIGSLVLCFAGGMLELEGGFLAISRTVAFLPWFALGYYLSPRTVAGIKPRRISWIAVAASALIIFARVANQNAYEWFFPMVYGDTPYDSTLVIGIIQKALAMIAGGIMSIALIKLAPSHRCWLTALGERTLQVYILHRLLRAALTFRTPFYEAGYLLDPLLGIASMVLLSAITIAICNSSTLGKTFNGMLRIDWIGIYHTVKIQYKRNQQFDIKRYVEKSLQRANRLLAG